MTTINNTNSDALQKFLFEFNSRLETFGVMKKFNEDVELLGLREEINLENINSYKNNDEWNIFFNLIDFYYPGLLVKFYPNIPFGNYVENAN